MHFAEKFECPNKEDYVYFQLDKKLELQNEMDTLLLGSLKDDRIFKSKKYGQGFLAKDDGFKDSTGFLNNTYLNDGR